MEQCVKSVWTAAASCIYKTTVFTGPYVRMSVSNVSDLEMFVVNRISFQGTRTEKWRYWNATIMRIIWDLPHWLRRWRSTTTWWVIDWWYVPAWSTHICKRNMNDLAWLDNRFQLRIYIQLKGWNMKLVIWISYRVIGKTAQEHRCIKHMKPNPYLAWINRMSHCSVRPDTDFTCSGKWAWLCLERDAWFQLECNNKNQGGMVSTYRQ